MNRPWLPPEPYTYSSRYRFHQWVSPALVLSITDPLPEPTESELRWQAEDRWLRMQWELTEEHR
jgi:hypothetical protein